jgi:hypothetical protein
MSMEFASPGVGGSGDSVTPSDLDGHLLVIEPSEHVQGIATTFGEKDAIRATIHDITAQSTHTDVLLFPGGLIGALKGRVGQRVLAVMGKGAAKPGQAAPWILTDASGVPEAVQAATAYLTGQTAASMAAPAAPAPAVDPQADALAAALGNLAGLTK